MFLTGPGVVNIEWYEIVGFWTGFVQASFQKVRGEISRNRACQYVKNSYKTWIFRKARGSF